MPVVLVLALFQLEVGETGQSASAYATPLVFAGSLCQGATAPEPTSKQLSLLT